jgi:hypothetical protein
LIACSDVPSGAVNRISNSVLVADKIEEAGEGRFKIDDKWTLLIASPSPLVGEGRREGAKPKPVIRQQGDMELLIPVTFDNQQAEIQITYDW